ncbi:protease modulator HflC [Roseomonas elaeocarpi]|uniref:Protein HflC n=1 Tax=Roseomonas elaeocarpi TaxID=907779 RepID=A0ABV6JP33_9PROT
MNRLLALGVAAAVVLILVTSTLFTVNQTQQVMITQFGRPVRIIQTPGLHAKIPLIQTVVTFDRRLLDFEAPGEEVILSDQRRLIVDSFARFEITDPQRYYETVGAQENGIRARLSSIVSSSLRRVLGNETLLAVLSNDRLRIMNTIRDQVNAEARAFGIQVEDVRIRRADFPEENTQAILSRMQSERERVAREARAEGAEIGAQVRARADRERTVLIAEAQAQADILRGQGEAEATKLYAAAFGQDPQFFDFWRSMQAYRDAFAEGGAETRLLLSPDSAFFRFFRSPLGAGALPTPQPSATPGSPEALGTTPVAP